MIQRDSSSSRPLEGNKDGKEAEERAGEKRRGGLMALRAPSMSWRRQREEKGTSGERFAERRPQNSNQSHFLGVRALNGPSC